MVHLRWIKVKSKWLGFLWRESFHSHLSQEFVEYYISGDNNII